MSTKDLIAEMTENVNKYGSENTVTHLMVQAIEKLCHLDLIEVERDALRAQVEALKKALRQIADAEPMDGDSFVCDFDTLQGVARAALTGEQSQPSLTRPAEFDDCAASPTGKHSENWYANDDCEHCKTGSGGAKLILNTEPVLTRPAMPEVCGGCNGSGRMVRDPDIGTDQECFVCDGSGLNIDSAPQPDPTVKQSLQVDPQPDAGIPASETDDEMYQRLEREHMGDPDKKTGIYAPHDAAPQPEGGA